MTTLTVCFISLVDEKNENYYFFCPKNAFIYLLLPTLFPIHPHYLKCPIFVVVYMIMRIVCVSNISGK